MDNLSLMNDPKKRKFLLCGVLAIGFLVSVVVSVAMLLGWYHPSHPTQGRLWARLIFQFVGLLSLYLALRYQGRRWKDIGFFLEPTLLEIGRIFALFFVAWFLSAVYQFVVSLYSPSAFAHKTYDPVVLLGTSASYLAVLWVFVNPFHEELIVRAFLITEVEGIYHSTWLAVIASVALQTSYHLYQGLVSALSHVPVFLLFSLYYVRSRRILPVVLAHLIMDVLYLYVYARHYW